MKYSASRQKTVSIAIEQDSDYIAASGISLNYYFTEIYVHDSVQLTAAITPENATDQTVTWYSSYPSAVSVDSNGLVTVNSYYRGYVLIVAVTADGAYDLCLVKAVKPGRDHHKEHWR